MYTLLIYSLIHCLTASHENIFPTLPKAPFRLNVLIALKEPASIKIQFIPVLSPCPSSRVPVPIKNKFHTPNFPNCTLLKCIHLTHKFPPTHHRLNLGGFSSTAEEMKCGDRSPERTVYAPGEYSHSHHRNGRGLMDTALIRHRDEWQLIHRLLVNKKLTKRT